MTKKVYDLKPRFFQFSPLNVTVIALTCNHSLDPLMISVAFIPMQQVVELGRGTSLVWCDGWK